MYFDTSPSSSTSSSAATTPSTSPSHPQVSIGFTPNGTDALLDIYPRSSQPRTSTGLTCAYPSWPSRPTFSPFGCSNTPPSSFVSDEDLLCGELLPSSDASTTSEVASAAAAACYYLLSEAPKVPRQHHPFAAAAVTTTVPMPLPPLYAPEKSKRRRRGSPKQRRPSKPMTPISESPEAPE